MPENIFDNSDVDQFGNSLTNRQACYHLIKDLKTIVFKIFDFVQCMKLEKPENLIGK